MTIATGFSESHCCPSHCMQRSGQKSDVVRSLFCTATGHVATEEEEDGDEEEEEEEVEVEGKVECTLRHRLMTQFLYACPNCWVQTFLVI